MSGPERNGSGRNGTAARAPEPCPFEDDVLVLADGVLEPSRRLLVEAHLGVCDPCAALDDMLDRTSAAIRAEPAPRLAATERALANLPRRGVPRVLIGGAAAAAFVALWYLLVAGDGAVPGTPQVPAERGPRETADPVPREAPATPADEPDRRPEDADDSPFPNVPPAADLENVAEAIAALDPAAADDDPALAAVVRRIRAAGAAGPAALNGLLGSPDLGVAASALRVSASLRSTSCVRALGDLLDQETLAPEAARQLGALGSAPAIAELARGLDGPARSAVLAALVTTGSARAFDVLETRLRTGGETPLPVLRAAVALDARRAARTILELEPSDEPGGAVEDLLRSASADLVPPLAEIARSSDGLAAAAAVRALGATGDDAAVPGLVAAAARPSLARRSVEALVAIGTPDACAAAFDVATNPRTPRGALASFDGVREAAPVLVAALDDERAARREAAVEALGRAGDEAAVPALAPCLADPRLRRTAIDALGRIGGDRAAALLAPLADRRTGDARLVAALGATRSPLAVKPLRTLASESSLSVPAAMALGRIASPASVVALAELLSGPRTARDAADGLRGLPAGLVVPTLLARLEDPEVGADARRALVVVARRDLGPRAEDWVAWWDERSAPVHRLEDQP